jgi:drug/metabolite transporter (DMT)-like permease
VDGFRNASLPLRRPIAASVWADLSVLGVAVVWGASYPVAKGALLYAPVLILILYRFVITTIIMTVVARREIVSMSCGDLIRGFILGTILFSIFLAETYGVALTSATNTALIISLCVIFTPILDYGLSRKLPPLSVIVSAIMCCLGVGILTGGVTAFGAGDLLVLSAAMLRAVMVVSTKRLMRGRQISSAALTAVQGFAVTVLASIVVITQFGLNGLVVHADPQFWLSVAFLSLFCTIAAFYIQNAAVRRTTPTRVGFLMGTEPFFGFLLAYLLLAEPISVTSVSGAALILTGTFAGILSENRTRP